MTRPATSRPDKLVGGPAGRMFSAVTSINANSVASLYVADFRPVNRAITRSANRKAPSSDTRIP